MLTEELVDDLCPALVDVEWLVNGNVGTSDERVQRLMVGHAVTIPDVRPKATERNARVRRWSNSGYTEATTKRLVAIDDTAFEHGHVPTRGAKIKDTVNPALREFSEMDTRVCLFAHIQELATSDLSNPDIMKGTLRDEAPE